MNRKNKNDVKGVQTISSMFRRQYLRNNDDKGKKRRNSKITDDNEDDDVIILDDTDTTSTYFDDKKTKTSYSNEKRLKLAADVSVSKVRKKSKLSLPKDNNTNNEKTDDTNSDLLNSKTYDVDATEQSTGLSLLSTSDTHFDDEQPCASYQNSNKTESVKENDCISEGSTENNVKLSCKSLYPNKTSVDIACNKVDDEVGLGCMDDDKKYDEQVYTITNPYYFNNFEAVLSAVITDNANISLFDQGDMDVIHRYRSQSDGAKKMYIRLFCRKLKWISLSKLNYPEIGSNLEPYLMELVEADFLYNDTYLTDLSDVLEAMSAPDVKTLAKLYHIPATMSQKHQQIAELIKHTQRTNISHMFGSSGGQDKLAQAMTTKAKKYLPSMYRLREVPRAVFVRVMMLFSVINTSIDEDSGIGGQSQLFQMLMVNMGKLVYPTYEVNKTQPIFRSRDDVIRLSHALQLESDLLQATEKGRWNDAYQVFLLVKKMCENLEQDHAVVSWNKSLPIFLRSFTATSVVYRLLSQGIEIIQRRKDFKGAVEHIKTLLDQEDYCCTYRGYWWERLALNLDAHIKTPEKALEACLSGLADPHVQVGHRLALYQRGQTICQRPRLKLGHRLSECNHPLVREIPKVELDARVMHGSTGSGPRFLTESSYRGGGDDGGALDLEVCGVEEFVLDYYKNHGYPSGIHAEGSVITSLFALFFWDILFMSRPNVFQSPYQAMPLDLYTDGFYQNRKKEIDTRLDYVTNSSVEELSNMVKANWTEHEGVMCAGMNWERMRSAESVMDLVSCIGPTILSGLLKRFALNPRHTRSGFPDLTLWNSSTSAFKICEVKGPGDRLSHKQILWLNYLLELGVDAEVCHVKAVAAKRLLQT